MERHVLFICVRNRVRSVYAEFYLRKQLDESIDRPTDNIKISSAGLNPKVLKKFLDEAGISPPEPFFHTDMSAIVRERLRAKDIHVPDLWRSKPLTSEMVRAADLIVTALTWQKDEIERAYAPFCSNIFTFKELAEWDDTVLFETLSGLPMDSSFWDYCEEDRIYVTKVINEVENLMDLGFQNMLRQLGIKW